MPQLLNPLATAEQLEATPSRLDGIPASLEEELRMYGCQLIQQAGILLKLPQVTMATAQVLLQRFYFVSSFKSFSLRDVCMGALFLASKLEETPRRLRDLVNVFDYSVQRARHSSQGSPGFRSRQLSRARRRQDKSTNGTSRVSAKAAHDNDFVYEPMSYFSSDFYDAKDALVIAEMQLLKRLGFQLQVNLPYATMINYLQLLGLADPKLGMAQRAWSLLNDALQTPVFALFSPHVLATSAIYLASLTVDNCPPLPLHPAPWWELFDATRDEIRLVSSYILRLYSEASMGEGDKADLMDADEEVLLTCGLASRVRDEHGGLVEFLEKAAVREWLATYGHAIAMPQNGTSRARGAVTSAGSTPLRAPAPT